MEPKFQNAFIPKRPVVTAQNKKVVNTAPKRKTSFLGMLTTLVFIAALAGSAGVFGYTKYIENDILKKDLRLQEERAALEPDLIEEIGRAHV